MQRADARMAADIHARNRAEIVIPSSEATTELVCAVQLVHVPVVSDRHQDNRNPGGAARAAARIRCREMDFDYGVPFPRSKRVTR